MKRTRAHSTSGDDSVSSGSATDLTRREMIAATLATGAALGLGSMPAQAAHTWPGGTPSRWNLSNPDAPEMVQVIENNSFAWLLNGGSYGTDFVVEADLTQLQATGPFYGIFLEAADTHFQVLLQPDRVFVRRMSDGAVLGSASVTTTVGVTCRLRVVATEDRIQVKVDNVPMLDVRGAASWSGKFGLVSYNVLARYENIVVSPPTSIADCQDIRPLDTSPWWFPNQTSVNLPVKIRDAASVARSFSIRADIKFDTQKVFFTVQTYTPAPRSWEQPALPVDLGQELLYWAEISNTATGVVYGEWPVARHPQPVANTFPAASLALGTYNKEPPLIDLVARKTYWHALCNALLRDSFNAAFGIKVQSAEELDIFEDHGISVVLLPPSKPTQPIMEHAAVLAYQVGDEPKDDDDVETLQETYEAYRTAWPNRPSLTAMIGDAAPTIDYHRWWRQLGAERRLIRVYPFHKSTYGATTGLGYKGALGCGDTFAWLNAGATITPWYYVPQTFRSNPAAGPEPFWRLPTASEAVSTMHLAGIFGASGYFCFSYEEITAQGSYDTLVEPRTLQPLTASLLDGVRDCNQRMRQWPSATRGQFSQAARAFPVPYAIYTRRLADGTIALVNLDPANPVTYASTDLSRATSYDGVQNSAWTGGSVTLPPGGIAFGVTSDPTRWRPAAASFYRNQCQSLISAVTPTQGTWPSIVRIPSILIAQAAMEWHRTVQYGPDAELSPLSFLRLMSTHQSAWTIQSADYTSVTGWRMAQIGYAFGARSAVDVVNGNLEMKFGPYTPDNNPPTFPEAAALISAGVTCLVDFRSNNLNVLVVARYLSATNSRMFLFVQNLVASAQTVEIMNGKVGAPDAGQGTQLYDVYSGATQSITQSTYDRRVTVTMAANALRVFEWKP